MGANIRSSNSGAAAVSAKAVSPGGSSGELKVLWSHVSANINLIVGVLVVLAFYVLKAPLIALIDHEISEISVQGNLKHLSHESISAQVTPWLDESFLTSDLNQMKAEVQSLPWVYDSTLTRVWPGKVEITAVEQTPIAIWNSEYYLNADGDIYRPNALTWEAPLPSLFGPEESHPAMRKQMMSQLGDLDAMFERHGFEVGALRLKSRGAWEMMLNDGTAVLLGAPPFESKVMRVIAVLNGAQQGMVDRMAKLDARYPNGVAIQWKDELPDTLPE